MWGSAVSHAQDWDRRDSWDVASLESRVSLEIPSRSGQTAQITGSRDVVCKTRAEYTANKLNRNEQTKLESIRFRVCKEKEISQRKYTLSERLLRAKSAKLVNRIQSLESSSYAADRPMSQVHEKRPHGEHFSRRIKSYSAVKSIAETNYKLNGDGCRLCKRIQQIIQTYEQEGKRTGILEENTNHSTCLFSDIQVETFIHILEGKYFNAIPGLNSKLRDIGVMSHLDRIGDGPKISREEINNKITMRNVELRIKQFCNDVDVYKRTHTIIPKEVQDAVERVRLENAVVIVRRTPAKQEQIRKEVEELLHL